MYYGCCLGAERVAFPVLFFVVNVWFFNIPLALWHYVAYLIVREAEYELEFARHLVTDRRHLHRPCFKVLSLFGNDAAVYYLRVHLSGNADKTCRAYPESSDF